MGGTTHAISCLRWVVPPKLPVTGLDSLRLSLEETEMIMTLEEASLLLQDNAAEGSFSVPSRQPQPEKYDVIVIGGGQAGLSVGYHLSRIGARFVILDAAKRVGDTWRQRWDSLRLFTPAKFNGLDGMPFPAHGNYFPSKDEMGDYLEAYARRLRLPVRSGVRVDHVSARDGGYVVRAGAAELQAREVVVALGRYQQPKLPDFAAELPESINQLHSSGYRNPGQLRQGGVLVVGAGNSGADIALEVAASGHRTWLAGGDVGEVPFRPDSFLGRNLLGPLLLGVVFRHLLTVRTPLGRKVRPKMMFNPVPLIRVKRRDLKAAGIERVPRVSGVRDGRPALEDGRGLDVANVIWCSGYHPGFSWIDLPAAFDDQGEPKHDMGVVDRQPGLYFVGLPFLYAMSSSMIHGVGRDAARVVETIRHRLALPASQNSMMWG